MSHHRDPTQAPDNGTPSVEGDATYLYEVAKAIDCDHGQYGGDPVLAANSLQESIGAVSDPKLEALAAIARASIDSPFLCLVLFVWIRDHLCSSQEYGAKSQKLFRSLEDTYKDHNRLFYEPLSQDITLCIITSRGLMEAQALDRAISKDSQMETFSECRSWARIFRKGYIQSVLQNKVMPVREHKVLALLLIRKDILLGDYIGVEFKKAATIARSVFRLIGGSDTGLGMPMARQGGNRRSWHLLGMIFNAACKFVAEDPLVEVLREKVEGRLNRLSFPKRFLDMAICCFNEGLGWKIARFMPPQSTWDACGNINTPEYKRLCIITGQEVEQLVLSDAGNELSASQRVGLASLSNRSWEGSTDRAELARTVSTAPPAEIETIFILAQDLGGRRFGSNFQLQAFRTLARMTEDERRNIKSQIEPLSLSLLNTTVDDRFLEDNVLSILQCPESERQGTLQRVQDIIERRSRLRGELSEGTDYSETEIDALLLAAGPSVNRLSELRELILATRGRIESPVILLRELWRHKVRWDEVASLFDRMADVIFDSQLLSHHTLQVIRTSRNEREELCASSLDTILSRDSIHNMLNIPSLAHLTEAHRKHVLNALRRVQRVERYAAAEITIPMLERLEWRDARDGLDEILRAPAKERVSRRNQIMRSKELPDIENVMRSRSISQTQRAVQQIIELAQSDPSVVNDRQRILDSIESHILSYFPGLAPEEARRLLRLATCISREQHPSHHDAQKRDEVVSRLAEEIRTRAHPSEPKILLSIRAEAPEIANAWRTLAGDPCSQDLSKPLKSTRSAQLGHIINMGTLAAMVWRLIDTYPEHASRQRILDPGFVRREQAEMRFTFLMALAQCIDESDLQLVYSYGLSQRLCIALQGVTRYSSIVLDLTSPPQRFTQVMHEFHEEHKDDVDGAMIVQLQQALCEGATEEERLWYHAELVKYCSLTDWPSPPYL